MDDAPCLESYERDAPSSGRTLGTPRSSLSVRSDPRGERREPFRQRGVRAVMQAADFREPHDAARAAPLDRTRIGCVLAEREVRPRTMVVDKIGLHQSVQVALVDDTQNTRSAHRTAGLGWVRRRITSCWRSARFSRASDRCLLQRTISSRTVRTSRGSMAQHSPDAHVPKVLETLGRRVLANHRIFK